MTILGRSGPYTETEVRQAAADPVFRQRLTFGGKPVESMTRNELIGALHKLVWAMRRKAKRKDD